MKRVLFSSLLILSMGCSLAPRESTVRAAPSASTAAGPYRSYALVRAERVPEVYRRLDFTDREQTKLEVVARDVLGDRGFTEGSFDSADVILYLAVGKRAAEGSSNDAAGSDTVGPMTEATEDTLTLDAFDADTREHLWHGRTWLRAQADETTVAETEFRSLLAALPVGWAAEAEPQFEEVGEDSGLGRDTPMEARTASDDEFDEFAGDFEEAEAEPAPSETVSTPVGPAAEPRDDEFDDEF